MLLEGGYFPGRSVEKKNRENVYLGTEKDLSNYLKQALLNSVEAKVRPFLPTVKELPFYRRVGKFNTCLFCQNCI